MKNISFNNPEEESAFKKFVCENKQVIDTFLTMFSDSVKNPIVKVILNMIVSLVKNICA